MPGEQPRGAPPAGMTTDLPPCRVAGGLGGPSPHALQDRSPTGRGPLGTRETGSKARAREPPKAPPRQAAEAESEASRLRGQALGSPPRKGSGPRVPPGRSHTPAHTWPAGRAASSPPPLYSLGTDQASHSSKAEAPQARGTATQPRPSLPRARSLPVPEELSFQEAPSGFTSTDCTSPRSTPGPPPLRTPQSRGTSPHRPASLCQPQPQVASLWPTAAESNFQGVHFGVPSAELEPFPEGRRPGSPRGSPFGYPALARSPPGADTEAFAGSLAGQEPAPGPLLLTFHPPMGMWAEAAGGPGPAYLPPSLPAQSLLPGYPGQTARHEAAGPLEGVPSPSAAAHSSPNPFPDSLHKSLTKVLPEGPPSAHEGLGLPRGLPNPLPLKYFAGKSYGANEVDTSPGPLDTELPVPGPPASRLPLLWDPAVPYAARAPGLPAAVKAASFEGQLHPGQQYCLPHRTPMSWPTVLPTSGPSPHQMGVLSQLPFSGGGPKWPGDSQGAPGSTSTVPSPGESLVASSLSPGQPGGSPGLLSCKRPNDPGARPPFFGGTQPQVSPRGAPGLPPPHAVGASPSESPLPSPATHTAGSSTCSSLSPPSSSPANPSSEDSQLPGSLPASAFFHAPAHSQETCSPFPSPEPPQALATHYQAFPFRDDRLGTEGTFQGLEEGPGAGGAGPQDRLQGPAPYLTLSSASLDQLDVLLTCRQCDCNYSSLAAFLEHRQFCSLRPPRATPKAPADTGPGPLSHSQAAPFLLAEGREDPLRTGLLPGLATAPFPLPASDLDLEDDAKLDSLITEALNGLEYQADSPELDSSFIDVFADEEPSSSRAAGPGQPPGSRAGATPEDGVQSLLAAPAAASELRTPGPGDRNWPAPSRPKTRSLSLAASESATSPARPQRRGKQLKLFQKDLDMANSSTKGPARAICLRPRRRGRSADRVAPCPRDLRTQPGKGPADSDQQVPAGTRSSKRPRLPPGKDPRKRRVRGGSWSKEFIHKIVQQKNKRYRQHTPHGRGVQGPPLAGRLRPSARESGLGAQGCSDSEEEEGLPPQGPGSRGRPRPGRRRGHRAHRQREEKLTRGPQEAGNPEEETHSTRQSLDAGDTPVEKGPEHSDRPPVAPASAEPLEETQPSLRLTPEPLKPERAASVRPDTVKPREVTGPPAPQGKESPRGPQPSRDRPSGSRTHALPGQGVPTPSGRALLDPSAGTELCMVQDGEACSTQPGSGPVPTANTTAAPHPQPSVTSVKDSAVGCNPAHFNRDSTGVPAAPKGSRADSGALPGWSHTPTDGAGCLPEDLYSTGPLAVHTCSPSYLGSEGVDTFEPHELEPPKNARCAAERDLDRARSPLALATMSLFSGPPEDGFDLAANRDTHRSLAHASPLPGKPVMDALCPSFLLLEAEPPVLPSQRPALPAGKACGETRRPPCRGTLPPSPAPVPGKGIECSAAFTSDLWEDELEIKRLVTELESQLPRRAGVHVIPGEAEEAAGADGRGPGPGPGPALQAALLPRAALLAVGLPGLGDSSPRWEEALRSPHGQWPCPDTGCATSPPGTDFTPALGAPFDPSTDSLGSRAAQEAGVPQMERGSRRPSGGHLPDSSTQEEPLSRAGSSAKGKPNSELLVPNTNRTTKMQSKVSAARSRCPPRGGAPPPPCKAGQPRRDLRLPEPVGHVTPEVVLWGHGGALPDTAPPLSACPHTPSPGRAGEPERATHHPVAEESGFEGEDLVPAGPQFCPVQSPAWVPDSGPRRRPWDPASCYVCPLPVLGIRGGDTKDTQAPQTPPGLPAGDAQGPRPRGPSDGGGDREKGGSPQPAQSTAVPAAPGYQPEADGQMVLPGCAEKPEAQREGSPGRSGKQRGSREPHLLTKLETGPEGPAGSRARNSHVREGDRVGSGSPGPARAPPGPTSSGPAAAEGRILETVTSPGLVGQPLHGGERPAAPLRDPDTCAPAPTSLANPASRGPQLPPRGALPSAPPRVAVAPGELRDPPSPPHPPASPASSPAWVPLEGTNRVQPPTRDPLSLMRSHRDPARILPCHRLLPANGPEDLPTGQPGLVDTLGPARHGGDSTLMTLEDSRREELGRTPAHDTAPPPRRAVSPGAAVRAAGLSGIPTPEGTEAPGGLVAPNPHFRGAPLPTTAEPTPEGPASGPPRNTPGPDTSTVSMDLATPGITGSGPGLEAEVAAGGSQGGPGTRGIARAVAEMPRASTPSPTTSSSPPGLQRSQEASAGDPPLSLIGASRKPLSPKRRPRGFKRKAEPMEKGQGRGQAPAEPPVTCEVCSARFCTVAGLSRHRARKHRPRELACPPHAPRALEPTAQTCRAPRKRGHRAPGKAGPSSPPAGPSHRPGPAPADMLGAETAEAAPQRGPGGAGAPLSQPQPPSGPSGQRKGVNTPAAKPSRPGPLEASKFHARKTEPREGRRQAGEPTAAPRNPERTRKKQAGAPRAGRPRELGSPRASACGSAGLTHSDLPTATGHHPASGQASPEGRRAAAEGPRPHSAPEAQGPDGDADRGLGPLGPPRSPQGWLEGGLPQDQPGGRKEVTAGQLEAREAGDLGTRRALLQAAGSPQGDRSSAQGGLHSGPGPPEASGSAAGSTAGQSLPATPDTGGGAQEPAGAAARAPSPGRGDPLSMFDDEQSFSQLFPLGGRLAGKKSPRVYGKCCKRPQHPLPARPPGRTEDRPLPASPRLPTDLSDSGSLCLSQEDLWDDHNEAVGLPEPFFTDGFLTQVPGLDPWPPSLGLWTLEPSRVEEGPSRLSNEEEGEEGEEEEEKWPEAIPRLHMVPAAWRGLELRGPEETPSSLGDASPEPPNLEREHVDDELPGDSGLLPLHAKGLEVLDTQLEMQDLRFLGSCDDLAGLLSPGLLDFQATANSQGPGSGGREAVAGAGRGPGGHRAAPGRKASHECPLCLQRFRGLGELDVHALAHGPALPHTCFMCVQRGFRSRELLREHLREKHVQAGPGPWACGMCLEEVADVWTYNQHLGGHAARFALAGRPLPPSGDLPPCLEEDSAFAHFLSSIMEQTSESLRAGGPGEAPGPKGGAEETLGGRGTPRPCSPSSSHDRALTPPGVSAGWGGLSALASTSATLSGPGKMSPSLSPDPWSHREHLLQAIPVHQDCKNLLRDCHHCGKPFPKPFKLQRHLAVHSPQRVYLCPRCPRVYAQHGELRAHLGGEHGVREERELPHTPLYTCELCANVTHAIRRSFICSSCNYTFAKKEQFDRHMDKHLRSGQLSFALRGARRPGASEQNGAPGWEASTFEGTLPSKRSRVALPSGQPGPGRADRPLSPGSPALSEPSILLLSQIFLEVESSTAEGQPKTQERPPRPASPVGRPVREARLPADGQELLPRSPSPLPDSLADGRGGGRLERALQRPGDGAPAGSPGPWKQPAPPEGKGTLPLLSGKRQSPGTRGQCAPGPPPGDPSLPHRKKLGPGGPMVPEGGEGRLSHKDRARKPEPPRSSPPDRTPQLPTGPGKPAGRGRPEPAGLAHRTKPTTPKAKPRPGSHGSGESRHSTKTGGGSQPQPASGQLQSETAVTPAKPGCPGPSPTPAQPRPQAQARGCMKSPREASYQGRRGCPGPREKKGQAPELARCDHVGNSGRAPSAPEKPPRAPRKQATPSRVPPARPRPGSQMGRTRPRPAEHQKEGPSHTPRKEAPGKGSPLPRPHKRGRHAPDAEPRDRRTAESQSHLLSQLFGQRLTSFKIPLKKVASEEPAGAAWS
ncbi:zinc finger protein 469-like [Dipodomys merriami]|uniref:zinc finger protein 469-like n=1 Tax=Dipodomys merriami TaxID=94247 RepID=UPI003855B492